MGKLKISDRSSEDTLKLVQNLTLFDDDLHIIYVNGTYDGNDKIGELMHDFRTANPDDMHDSVLKEQSNYLKRNEQGAKTMCKAVEEFAEKRVRAKLYEVTDNMLSMGMTVEQISKALGIPAETVLELQAELVTVG